MNIKFDTPNQNQEWKKNYRELQPVKLWGADIEVDDQESFKKLLVNSANKLGKNQFGYFLNRDGKIEYHLSRYPRRKYGAIPNDDQIKEQFDVVLETTGQKGREEKIEISPKFRIVLGLEEGYGTGKFYNIKDIASVFGNKFVLTPAEIFTVKAQDKEFITYQEPAVKIEGNLSDIKEIYLFAEKLKQERFAVDDFSKMTSHIVETKVCTSPDVE